MGTAKSIPAGKENFIAPATCSSASGRNLEECAAAFQIVEESGKNDIRESVDLTVRLTDDCLELVFGKLPPKDRKSCSLVCTRWWCAEARCRQLLLLSAKAELARALPDLLFRFKYVTKLALKCDRNNVSIGDSALFLVGKYARQLERLKLKGCKQVTDSGLEQFSKFFGRLRKLSCGSCGFGARGVNALVANCGLLEDLSVKKLKSLFHEPYESIGPGQRLKRLCLKDLPNAHVFRALIACSSRLQTIILARLSGDWDDLLGAAIDHLPQLTELRMEKLQISDCGLRAIARCSSLQILYVVKCPECTNLGLSALAQGCRSLRKLRLDGCFVGRMGDAGLKAIGEKCLKLQELVLIRLNVKSGSLAVLGLHCSALERLAICNSDTFGDAELCCVVFTCQALRKLCIKSCPISDLGLEALAGGCPNLVKVKIKKCRGISASGASFLQHSRDTVVVVADLPALMENPVPIPIGNQRQMLAPAASPCRVAKARLAFLTGPISFIACTFCRILLSFAGS